MQKLKKLFYAALTSTFLMNVNIPVNSTEKEVNVYSGRLTTQIEVFIRNLQKKQELKLGL